MNRYGYTLFVLICICFGSPVVAQGVSFLSFDTLLQQAYIGASSTIQQSLAPNSLDMSNIYDTSRDTIQAQSITLIKEPIDNTLDMMNKRYPTCQSRLNREDLITILSRRRSFVVQFSELFVNNSGNTSFPTMTQYVQSCQRLLSCMSNGTITPTDTQGMRDHCLSITQQQFVLSRIVSASQQQLIPKSDQLHLFMNGTIDDSPYDLLVDIQNISTLLFESPQAPPQVIAYRMPEVAGGSNGGLGSNASNQSAPVGSGFANQDTSAGLGSAGSTSSVTTNTSPTRSVSGVLGVPLPSNLPIGSVLSQQTIDRFIGGLAQANSTLSSQENKPDYIEEPLACSVEQGGGSSDTSDIQQRLNDISRDAKSLNASLNTQQRLLQALNNGKFSFGSGNSTGGLDADGGSTPESVDELVEQGFDLFADPDDPAIKSCLRRCEGLGFSDKMICKSKCLCGQIISPGLGKSPLAALGGDEYLLPPGAFTLRFCRVPATRQAVPQSPSVTSLEQMMTATNTVLKELKESGQLTKHKQTKEVLETSMQKTKLGQLFAFDLAISFKPIFPETSVSQRASDAQETVQRIKTQIKGSNNTDQQQERNKYLIKSDPCVIQNQDNLATTNQSQQQQQQQLIDTCRANQSPTVSHEIVSSAQMEQSVVLGSHIDGFIDAQQRLWAQMNEILLQIAAVSKTLQQRIATPN